MVHLGLLLAAFIVFILALWPATTRINLTALGLALLTASFLVPGR